MRTKNKIITPLVFLIINFVCLFYESAQANERVDNCKMAYIAVKNEYPKISSLSLDICKSRCGELTPELRKVYGVEDPYQYCLQTPASVGSGDPKALCGSSISDLSKCTKNCKPEYDSCLNNCRSVADVTERTEAFKRCEANYNGKPVDVADQAPVDPQDDAVDSSGGGDQTPVDPIDNNNTGDTNTVAQTQALEGLANTPFPETNLTNDASAIDFSRGPTPDRGGFQKAAAGVSSASDANGFVGLGHNNFNGELPVGEVVGGGAPNGAGGGNGNAGSNPAGGVPPMMNAGMMGGGGGGANGGAGAKRSGGNNNYRNGAAEYLNRHSPFSFQSGGNSGGANNSKRNVANNKKNFGPTYTKKVNDGKDALHRLFGNGVVPASYRRNPYGGSAACKDTIFCNMEIYYNKIERYPNHDINPDSF